MMRTLRLLPSRFPLHPSVRRRGRRLILLVLAMGIGVGVRPAPAIASVADLLGLGSRPVALGGAYTALADDWESLYYNPAGMGHVERSNFSLGFIWAKPRLYYQEGDGPQQEPNIYTTLGAYLGVTTNLAHLTAFPALSPFTFGISLFMPLEQFLLADIPGKPWDENYVLYLDQSNVFLVLVGLSCKPVKWLSIGLSGNFMGNLSAPNNADLEVNIRSIVPYLISHNESDLEKTVVPYLSRKLTLKVAPIVGVQVQPLSWLSVGVTYRYNAYAETLGSQNMMLDFTDFQQKIKFNFPMTILADIHYVQYWVPHMISGGIAFMPDDAWRVALDLTWSDWSKYIDPMAFSPSPPFNDTWTPRLGVEYNFDFGLALRGGYAYQPSPVPDQTGSYIIPQGSKPDQSFDQNYLDCDRHIFSIGSGFTWKKISWLKIWPKPLTIDAYFQYSYLPSRTYIKQPGFGPNIEMNGDVFNGGASLKLHF